MVEQQKHWKGPPVTMFTLPVAFVALISFSLYSGEILSLLRWFVSNPEPESESTAPQPTRLLDRLVERLRTGTPLQRKQAESILSNYSGRELIDTLLPFLANDPWDEGAAAAARLLLLHGGDEVIAPLHIFYSRQDGGFAAFLDELDKEQEFESSKVVSLYGASSSRAVAIPPYGAISSPPASFFKANKASVYRLKRS